MGVHHHRSLGDLCRSRCDVSPEPSGLDDGDEMSGYKVEATNKRGKTTVHESYDLLRLIAMAKHWLRTGWWTSAVLSSNPTLPKTIEELDAYERLMGNRYH